jgi:hypothetical protein
MGLADYWRLRGFLRGFEVEARDPAYWSARFWTGRAALCAMFKVLP